MPDFPVCERCGGPTQYEGRVSAPNHLIYGCDNCGHQTWVKVAGNPQFQQQQQPKTDPEE